MWKFFSSLFARKAAPPEYSPPKIKSKESPKPNFDDRVTIVTAGSHQEIFAYVQQCADLKEFGLVSDMIFAKNVQCASWNNNPVIENTLFCTMNTNLLLDELFIESVRRRLGAVVVAVEISRIPTWLYESADQIVLATKRISANQKSFLRARFCPNVPIEQFSDALVHSRFICKSV
jgi:hypothetical protein